MTLEATSGETIADAIVRPIEREDDPAIAALIRRVMSELGASGPGFAIVDPEVDAMSEAYARPGCAYFVVASEQTLLGAGGIAPLAGGDPSTCELRKMYLLPEARGRGLGNRLLDRCLTTARSLGYRSCYLETLATMVAAQQLYRRAGFRPLPERQGATGHFGCNRFYALEL